MGGELLAGVGLILVCVQSQSRCGVDRDLTVLRERGQQHVRPGLPGRAEGSLGPALPRRSGLAREGGAILSEVGSPAAYLINFYEIFLPRTKKRRTSRNQDVLIP